MGQRNNEEKMTRKRKRTLLVDGDILVYMISTQAEEATQWDDDLWTLHSDFKTVKEKFEASLHSYKEILLCDDIVFTFTDKKNFRKKILPTYKFNRKELRKPLTYIPLRQYVNNMYKSYTLPWLEGDDVLGLLATGDAIAGDKVILTKDKDLKTIPSTIYWMHDMQYEEISEQDATYNHMIQTLSGDASDNYKGCPKVGPKTAEKLLIDLKHDPVAMWYKVVETFKKAKLSEQEALIQAQVSYICRAADYNKETQTPLLWRKPL